MLRKEIVGAGILILVLVGVYFALPFLFAEPTDSAEPNESLKLNKTTEPKKTEYPVVPLEFFLSNEGMNDHKVTVEIFDSNNTLIFNETYEMSPGDDVKSGWITKIEGIYRYELTLDDKYNRTSYAGVSKSVETLDILVTDDPNKPFVITPIVS